MADAGEMRKRQEISQVKEAHVEELLKLPNVTGVFTDYKTTGGEQTDQLSIVVTVTQKKNVPKTQAVPKEIDGVPTDVIEEEIVPMHAVAIEDLAPAVDAASYATLEGGISIGPCRSVFLEPPEAPAAGNYVFVGTLGCMVTDNVSGDPMMLSNFHVMCINDAWSVGDDMTQPSRVDGGSCPAGNVGQLQRAVLSSNVDGAISSVSGRPHSCSIVDIGDINGTATATVDLAVRKRGRTTVLTHGRVTATDYTTSVDYGDGLGVVTLHNQIRIVNDAAQSAQFGIKGDSGSVVVNDSNEVVGLYFAGNTAGTVGVANPIAAVLSELNISMCTGLVKKKEFLKEWAKDFILEKDWQEEIFKRQIKEYIKEWKEYAYEKFAAFEGYDPWERFPPEVIQPPVERPPVVRPGGPGGGGFGGGFGRFGGSSLEQRIARLESNVRRGDTAMGDPKIDGDCADWSQASIGPGPNPVSAGPFSIAVLDHTGTPLPNSEVVSWGGHTGLNAGWTLEIKVGSRCPVVQATLVHFSRPPTMEAYNSDGTLAGSATMTPTQGVEQTLTIEGTAIERVRIVSPSNETLLVRLCCCADVSCTPKSSKESGKDFPKEFPKELKEFPKEIKPESKELKDRIKDWKELPKDLKDKDIKEPHKELKEVPKELDPKELSPKEFKEDPKELGPKEFKEDPKEFREPKGIKEPKEGKEIREGGGGFPPIGPGGLEARVAYLETMLGGAGHFIPSGLRPDLSRGALRYERGARLRQRG